MKSGNVFQAKNVAYTKAPDPVMNCYDKLLVGRFHFREFGEISNNCSTNTQAELQLVIQLKSVYYQTRSIRPASF